MLDAEDVLNGLIRGALSGRRKPWARTHHAMGAGSLVNAQTLLAAAGVAWGLLETWQRQQNAGGPGAGPATATAPAAPPPLPGDQAHEHADPMPEDGSLPPSLLQLVRLMVSAARADGEIGPAERERILREAREVGAEVEVERELADPRAVAEIVAGVSDTAFKEQLYGLAFTIVRADENVTGGERIYLAQLAHCLALDAAVVARLEAETAARIEAASASAQAGPSGDPSGGSTVTG